METLQTNKLEHVPIGSIKRKQNMFELLNEDLEDCLEILRQMTSCENKNEQLQILAENRINISDIKKTVDLCELVVYYNDKINNR